MFKLTASTNTYPLYTYDFSGSLGFFAEALPSMKQAA